MYYVLAEAITNAEKHAQADSVHVRVQVCDGTVIGEVIDDGVGGATMTLGGGLHGVDDRIRAMRGRCELSSPAGKGTRLKITVPLLEVTE